MTQPRPDFAALDFDAVRATGAPVAADPTKEWDTPEHIPQRSIYTAAALAFATHLGTFPGFAPFVRGPYPTMYVEKPWTVRLSDVKHPDRLRDLVTSARQNVESYRRGRRLHEDHGDWSMMTAMAHNFGIVIHYSTIDRQLVEVADHGFEANPEVYENATGRLVAPGDDTRGAWWFHLIARKGQPDQLAKA